jgi:hypothetical protein
MGPGRPSAPASPRVPRRDEAGVRLARPRPTLVYFFFGGCGAEDGVLELGMGAAGCL